MTPAYDTRTPPFRRRSARHRSMPRQKIHHLFASRRAAGAAMHTLRVSGLVAGSAAMPWARCGWSRGRQPTAALRPRATPRARARRGVVLAVAGPTPEELLAEAMKDPAKAQAIQAQAEAYKKVRQRVRRTPAPCCRSARCRAAAARHACRAPHPGAPSTQLRQRARQRRSGACAVRWHACADRARHAAPRGCAPARPWRARKRRRRWRR
jgi:hypothetical protein